MLLNVKPKEGTRNRNKPGRVLILRCDACDTIFERPYGRLRTQEFHACSRKCHGLLERKGAVHDVKKRQTSVLHYGVEHPRKSAIVEEQRKQTCMNLYGVPYVLQLQRVIDVAHSPDIEANRAKSIRLANVDGKPAKKRHETMKRTGIYGRTSKPEERCYELLCNLFGKNDIERQALINGWSIDFYIKSTNIYVQEDGVYHHGLDRSIEVISECKTRRDEMIYKRWLLDRQQDVWFASQNITLIRVTDQQINAL